MAVKDYDIDPQLLNEFLDESADALAPLEPLFIQLESDPENTDIVNQIFRPVHSLKGNSAFFGLLKTKDLSHKMENLLDLVRKKRKKVNNEVTTVLLEGLDALRSFIDRVRDGEEEVEDEPGYQSLLERTIAAAEEDQFDPVTFLTTLENKLKTIQAELPTNVQDLIDDVLKSLDPMREEFQTDQPASTDGPAPLTIISKILAEPFEDTLDDEDSKRVLDSLKELADVAASEETSKIIETALDEYDTFVNNIGFDPLLREMLLEKIQMLSKSGQWKSPDSPTGKPSVETKGEAPQTDQAPPADRKPKEDKDKTMRVSEKRIDGFLAYVGELVVVEEMFNFLHRRLGSSSCDRELIQEFKRILETFDALADNLRKSILTIRMVPINSILQKAPRIIHDIAGKTGKKVNVTMEGEDLNVDKSYHEILDAPLTHMVRNAIDHGIETPEARAAAGKDETGNIHISVVERENDIELALIDDGAGINFDAVKKKAVEIGLIGENDALTDEKLVDFLFEAGVSTAKKVTDVSGRGVGMDVVKRNIESVGGKIFIDTKPGEGTTFRITLPQNVTTQIMQGFLVKIGPETYVLPMSQIRESFAPSKSDISTVTGKGEVVSRHGTLYPVLRLKGYLNNTNENDENIHALVTIDIKNKRYAIAIDEIVGVQKVVVKPVSDLIVNDNLFDGAALMGDGTVAMVVNAEALQKLLEKEVIR